MWDSRLGCLTAGQDAYPTKSGCYKTLNTVIISKLAHHLLSVRNNSSIQV